MREIIEELEAILKANKNNIYCDEYQLADMIKNLFKSIKYLQRASKFKNDPIKSCLLLSVILMALVPLVVVSTNVCPIKLSFI